MARRWLCVEYRGAWPRDLSAHADPALRALTGRAAATGWRLLLIRRPGRRVVAGAGAGLGVSDRIRAASGPVTVFLADTDLTSPRVTMLTLPHGDLAQLPLPVGDEPLPGARVTEPLLLVCTHGRRDRCCALDGRALVGAVTSGCPGIARYVWESTHLGGHRFAPTALVLPTGYLYGRLDPATAIDVHKAAAHGEMEPLLCRGRSTWPAEGQVAELAVRRATGLREAAGLRVEPWSEDGAGEPWSEDTGGGPAPTPPNLHLDDDPATTPAAGRHEMLVTATDGRRWVVTVEPAAMGAARPTSCGIDPTPLVPLQAGAVRELAPLG